MIKIRHLIVSLLLIAMVGGICFAQKKSIENAPVKRIENYLAKLEKVGFSGSVLVAANGKTVISKGYGRRDAAQNLRNTPETVFDIGSVTKQFTAAAILKLEMQGKLSTDDKLAKYFQNVPPDKAEITIHQLLRHHSGLPGGVGGDFDRVSESEFLAKVFGAPLKFPTDTRFGYSNVGYSLLAMIVEKVSGKSYETYLYENLWKPAGMETTGYRRPAFDRSLIAIGYKGGEIWGRPNEKEWDTDAPFLHLKGNGSILSTTLDLYKWHAALLTDKILSAAAKEKYYRPKLRADETRDSYYAYGWDVHKTGGNRTVIQHNGINGVFYADFNRYLEDGVAIIMLSNKADQNFQAMNREIARIIFDPAYAPPIPVADTPANRAFTEAIVKLALEKGFAAAAESYRKRKGGVGLLERVVNEKGYNQLADKKTRAAIDLFRLNTYAFPRSANAFDSLGEAYLENGETRLAIENYRESLRLDPDNKNAAEVLKRIVK